jgi:hypothetical protein
MSLMVRPCTVKSAKKWIAEHHRHLKKMQGAMWAVRAICKFQTIGVAAVGNPAQEWQNIGVLCLLRMAVLDGYPNACSLLYGACSRAARAMGAVDLVTYTRLDEPGTSLKAAGWIDGGETDGGEYDRPSRPRQPALFPDPKRRWFAPWGRRARGLDAG